MDEATHTVLAHERLAIVDLENGAQPLTNEADTVWLSVNGEIYNRARPPRSPRAPGPLTLKQTATSARTCARSTSSRPTLIASPSFTSCASPPPARVAASLSSLTALSAVRGVRHQLPQPPQR